MKILAIETATEACSAALLIDDNITTRSEVAPRKHTSLILPMVDSLLQEAGIDVADLDAIAFGQGPGAFTGVRIAIGVVQGLAFAHDIPVIPVSSMAALAQQQAEAHPAIAVAIDARMQEVYWGIYQRDNAGIMQAVAKEVVCTPESIELPAGENWYGAGSGWQTYSEILSQRCVGKLTGYEGQVFPLATGVLSLAQPLLKSGVTSAVTEAAPVYLRNKVIN